MGTANKSPSDFSVTNGNGGSAADVARSGMDTAREAIATGTDRIKDVASTVATRARDIYDSSGQRLSALNDGVTDSLQRHPKQSVLIGFGVGCLVGALAVRLLSNR